MKAKGAEVGNPCLAVQAWGHLRTAGDGRRVKQDRERDPARAKTATGREGSNNENTAAASRVFDISAHVHEDGDKRVLSLTPPVACRLSADADYTRHAAVDSTHAWHNGGTMPKVHHRNFEFGSGVRCAHTGCRARKGRFARSLYRGFGVSGCADRHLLSVALAPSAKISGHLLNFDFELLPRLN